MDPKVSTTKGEHKPQPVPFDRLPSPFDEPEDMAEKGDASLSLDEKLLRHETASLVKGVRNLIARLKDAEKMATTDALTGLANRRAYEIRIEDDIKRAKRDGKPLSLLMLDIDHFKRVNDTYGHEAGDQILKKVSDILSGALHRDVDFIARYGGEEIVVTLPNTDSAGAVIVAEKMRQAVERESRITVTDKEGKPADLSVTISAGCASFDPFRAKDDEELDDSVITKVNADRALFQSKGRGRNRVTAHVFGEVESEFEKESRLAKKADAIERDLSGDDPETQVKILEMALARAKAKIKKAATGS